MVHGVLSSGAKMHARVLGGKAARGRRDGLAWRLVTVPLHHCCSLVVVPTLVSRTWVPIYHQLAFTLPSPRSASCISYLNWHPFANAGLSCFCRVLNPDSRPSTHPAPQLRGVWLQKGPRFLMLLVSHLPKCHLRWLVLPLWHCTEPQEPARRGHLPSRGCSALPPPRAV